MNAPGPRSEAVLDLLLQGCENKEIAKELGIATRTVKAHMNRLFLRYGLTDDKVIKRVQLAIIVYKERLCQEQTSNAS